MYKEKTAIFSPKQAGGGGAFGAPPHSSFFCYNNLIFDTITVKLFEFSKIVI